MSNSNQFMDGFLLVEDTGPRCKDCDFASGVWCLNPLHTRNCHPNKHYVRKPGHINQPKETPVKKDRRTRAMLVEELNKAKNMWANLHDQRANLNRELEEMTNLRNHWHNMYQQKSTAMEKQNQQAQAQLGELSNKVATKHAQVIKYSNELETAKAELINTRLDNDRLHQRCTGSESEICKLRKDLDSLKATINSCMTIIKEAMR